MKEFSFVRTAGIILIAAILVFLLRPKFFISLFSEKSGDETTVVSNASNGAPSADNFRAGHNQNLDSSFFAPGVDPSKYQGDTYNMDTIGANAQPAGGIWEVLLKLSYKESYDRNAGEMNFFPIFTPEIRALDGKEVTVKGYILPMEANGEVFLLSAYPAASCFYCNKNAGPQSIMEIYPKKPIPYEEGMVTIKGKLKLNYNDPYKFSYLLEGAQMVY
jgi:hypothetical protein